MSLYKHLEYREAIRWLIEQRRKVHPKLTLETISQHMRIKRSYLSQVLTGRAELSLDQMFLFQRYFDLPPDWCDYLDLLLESSRTTVVERKHLLSEKIEQMRKSHIA